MRFTTVGDEQVGGVVDSVEILQENAVGDDMMFTCIKEDAGGP